MAVAKAYGSIKNAKSSMKKRGGGANGVIVRLKAEETLKVRFLTEPDQWFEAQFHWPKGQKFPSWCSQEKSCANCKSGDNPRTCVLANVLDREGGKVVVMQMPGSLAQQVFKRYEKFDGTVMDRDYELSREGSSLEDTKYMVDYDAPSRFNGKRYASSLHDIEEIILADMGDSDGDDDEEDEEPRSSKKSSPARPKSRHADEDEDDEEDGEELEDEYDELDRSELKAAIKEYDPDFAAKKSQTDEDLREILRDLASDEEEDDEDEDDEEEDEAPAPRRSSKSSKSRRDGLDEFKPEKPRHPEARSSARLKRR